MQNNPNEFNQENESEEKFLQPNFFVIIPAPIMGDKELSDSEKLLYGVLLSLTSKLGFCFASNKYLADETGVCEQEIKNRLKHLEDRGHIKRETEKLGFVWKRKIFCISNNSYEGAVRPPRGKHMTPSEDHARRPYKDSYINKDKVVVCSEGVASPPPDPKGSSSRSENPHKIKKLIDGVEKEITLNDIFYQAIRTKQNWTTEEIQDAWNVLVKYEGDIYDYFAFIEGTIKNFRLRAQAKAINKKNINKKENQCTTQKKKSENTKNNTTDHDTKEQVYRESANSLKMLLGLSNNGLKTPKDHLSLSDPQEPEKLT